MNDKTVVTVIDETDANNRLARLIRRNLEKYLRDELKEGSEEERISPTMKKAQSRWENAADGRMESGEHQTSAENRQAI